jgi:hypothetical protein
MPVQSVPWSAWVGFLYVGIVSMWLGFVPWYAALARGGALRVSQVQGGAAFSVRPAGGAAAGRIAAAAHAGLPAGRGGQRLDGPARAPVTAGLTFRGLTMHPSQFSESSMPQSPWTLAHRAARMNPSIIREILKVTEKPGILSMAGGLPSADTFPVEELKAACERVLTNNPREALQYAASEGFAPLREWAAARVKEQLGIEASPDQVLITSGSQQGLDLVGKILCDAGAPVAVETPTYLGALQAFTPYEPMFVSLKSDADGPRPRGGARVAATGAGYALHVPAAQLPEPHRPRDAAGAPRRADRGGAVRRHSLRRGQPLWRPVVRRGPWALAGVALGGRGHLPGLVQQDPHAGLPPGLPDRPQAALPQAAAGQAGGRSAHPRASTSAWSTRW